MKVSLKNGKSFERILIYILLVYALGKDALSGIV